MTRARVMPLFCAVRVRALLLQSVLAIAVGCSASAPPGARPAAIRARGGGRLPAPEHAAEPRPLRPANARVGEFVGASAIAEAAPRGRGLTGDGVRAGVWDEGVARPSHVDLRGRVRPRDLGGLNDHATHTTATLAGSGEGLAAARGMAPAARVWAYDWALDAAEMEEAAAGVSVASNAYGPTLGWATAPACPNRPMWWGGQGNREDPAFGRYGPEAAAIDALAYRTDLLTVWPVGNERLDTGVAAGQPHLHAGSCSDLFDDAHAQEITLQFGTLGGAAVAKNALSVGAARYVPRDELTAARIVPLDMSSFGPTDDGRIKPELLAGGDAVRSASSRADDAYLTLSGSSSATAATAGVVALLTELYRTTHAGADPRAAELKALLVHSAREAGAPGPDYGSGYGLLDAEAAADLIAADGAAGAAGRQLVSAALADGDAVVVTTDGEIPAGTALRFTLAWVDPPAPSSTSDGDDATPTLVNDLDLVVTGPDGARAYPFTLDPADPTAAARLDGPNRRDNLEVVAVNASENTAAGRWQLRIEAPAGLWRGRVQAFALVSSVPLELPSQPALALPRYVTLDVSPGGAPQPAHAALANRGEGALRFSARSLTPWLAVSPAQGSAPASLALEVDPGQLGTEPETLGRVLIDSDDPAGARELGVVVRRACTADCSGRECGPEPTCGESCGDCAASQACAAGHCVALSDTCPAADFGQALGLALWSGQGDAGAAREQGSCGGSARDELGFAWSAPEAGRFAFTTRGSDIDSVLYARASCSGNELACNDDSGGLASAVALELTAGQTVVAFVDGLSAADSGRALLNVQRLACPSLDLGSRLGTSLVRASTAGGIDKLGASCGGAGAEDVAFGWTAPADGRYRFALFAPRYQAVLYVLDGDCDGRELGCSAAADVGPIELELSAGQTLAVVVDGREARSGDFALDILALDSSCGGSCGRVPAAGACGCDPACVAAGDCCADACDACGACRCQRRCDNRHCGSDGCGGSCGECGPSQACDAGKCAPDPCQGVTCAACTSCVAGRCMADADGAACEDGNLCTVLDRCNAGHCEGRARVCDDGFDCTVDRCDPHSGECEHAPDPSCCEPGQPCATTPGCDASADACRVQLADAGATKSSDGGRARPLRQRAQAGCGCRIARGELGWRRGQPVALALGFALASVLARLRRRRRAPPEVRSAHG